MLEGCTGKAPKGVPCPAILAMRESTIHQKASSSFCSARTSEQGPLYPTLRANPFPEVTDLFCRLPLPTLFYRPEAANLGDLMRLWVRPGVSSSFCLAQTSVQGPLHPTLRANLFPKVTDLFCRLPLPTLFYKPEAVNLGDLMRLWVRIGVQIKKRMGLFKDS